MVAAIASGVGNSMLVDATQISRFLLMYRSQSAVRAIVVEAYSLADALTHAADFGLNAPTFRLGQELEAKLAALVRPDQVNRILSRAETKELLTMFMAHKSLLPHREYLRAAE
jgi:hypothetical protein